MDESFYFDGKYCPYCGGKSKYVDSSVVYRKSYGMIYYCKKDDAYCGVHKGSDKSLWRLANKELREWKKKAHESFDKLWDRKMREGFSKHEARTKAYDWLSQKMNIIPEHCHIGMFDVDKCKKVIQLCKPYI